MRRSVFVPIIFNLLLLVTLTQRKVTAMPSAIKRTNTCVRVGQLISVQGQVEIKRKKWLNYYPVTLGTTLCQGDLIRPIKDAKAVVQCADPDQNLWVVPKFLLSGVNISCRPADEPIFTIDGPITPTRDPLASHIPYIITPNNTWILSARPKLRWVAVPGAISYVVRVIGPGVKWVKEVNTPEIVYSGEQPLQPVEEGYLITVESDRGITPARATFGLLDQKKATRVQAAAERMARENLTDEEKTLAITTLFIGQGLITPAIERLELAIANGSQTPVIYYTLGNLYAQLELFHQAKENYLKAVQSSTNTYDIEGQVATATKLGEVYQVIGEPEKATYWLKQAQAGYKKLI